MTIVSVIIPNYNHAPYLQQRIESVLYQTYQNFELIILDDCSTDNSKEIIESYRSHSKISHVIYNETNSGSTFKQWERGIGLAQGDYIWIAESDDWCEATLLQTLVNGITFNTDCTVAYCQSFYIRNTNEIFHYSHAKQLEECMNGKDYINKHLVYHSSIYNASMALFKKEVYEKISKDFTNFRFCGDWVFWSEMVSHGDVFISGKLLNYFRFHDKDVSTNMYKTGLSFTELFRCMLLLKHKFSISDALYRKALSHYTTTFFVQKKQFSPEIIKSVEDILNNEENKKHSVYLRKAWLINRIKRVAQKSYQLAFKSNIE